LAPKTVDEIMVGAAITAELATAVLLIKDLLVDFI
jgi:hypothetical protein